MRSLRLALVGLSLAFAFAPPAQVYGKDDEEENEDEDEGEEVPLTLADALAMLGQGRTEAGWDILAADEDAAKKAALEGLKAKDPFTPRGSALYLAQPKVWGKERGTDHPRWRAPFEEDLVKTRQSLKELEAALKKKKLKAGLRRTLLARQKKAKEREGQLIELVGILGTTAQWKQLVDLVRTSKEAHVIHGATRGLLGPRGGLVSLMKELKEFERPNAKLAAEPPHEERVAVIQKELERVARSRMAMELVESVEDSPSAVGITALIRVVDPEARERAWRLAERAGRDRSSATRVAVCKLIPRLRGSKSQAEFLSGLVQDDADPVVRAAAASSMGRLSRRSTSQYLEVLVEALKDVLIVRNAACKSLVQLTGHRMGPVHKAWERWLAKQ